MQAAIAHRTSSECTETVGEWYLSLTLRSAERWIELRRPRFLDGADFVNSNPLFYDLLGDFQRQRRAESFHSMAAGG